MLTRGGWVSQVPKWWPVGAAVVGLIAMGAQASARVDDQGTRIQTLESSVPALDKQIGRIEERVNAIGATQLRIEDKLDRALARR